MTHLTYEQLFDILRREKSRDELQELDTEFHADAARFFEDKDREARSASGDDLHSLAAQRASIELQNTKRILKELYERRERKIVTMALHRTRTDAAIIDTQALLPEEKELFDRLVGLLRDRKEAALPFVPSAVRSGIVERVPPARAEQSRQVETAPGDTMTMQDDEDHVPVKFLSTVPKFVGKDLQVYGPFQEGDETRLPQSVVRVLQKKGRIELVQENAA